MARRIRSAWSMSSQKMIVFCMRSVLLEVFADTAGDQLRALVDHQRAVEVGAVVDGRRESTLP